jgi:hypothetical protein
VGSGMNKEDAWVVFYFKIKKNNDRDNKEK